MCKSIFKAIFVFLAVVIGSLDLMLLSLRWQLLNPSFLKSSLAEAGTYQLAEEVVTDVIKSYLNTGLMGGIPGGMGEVQPDLLLSSQEFLDILSQKVITFVKDDLQLQKLLQETIESNVDNIFSWANKQKQAIDIYLPISKLKAQINDQKIVSIISSTIKDSVHFDQLPQCTDDQLALLLMQIQSMGITSLPCTHPAIEQQLDDAIKGNMLIDENTLFNEILFPGLANTGDTIPLQTLVPDPNLYANIDFIRTGVEISNILLLAVLVVSVILALLAVVFNSGSRFKVFFKIYLTIGILLVLFGLLVGFVLPRILMDNVNIDFNINFGEGLPVDPSVSAKIPLFIEQVVSASLANLFKPVLIVGAFLIVIDLLFIVLIKIRERHYSEVNKQVASTTQNP